MILIFDNARLTVDWRLPVNSQNPFPPETDRFSAAKIGFYYSIQQEMEAVEPDNVLIPEIVKIWLKKDEWL